MELLFKQPLAEHPLNTVLKLLIAPGITRDAALEIFHGKVLLSCQPGDECETAEFSVGELLVRSEFSRATKLVHALLCAGVEIDRLYQSKPFSKEQVTMLHDAAVFGSADILALLLEAGADPRKCTRLRPPAGAQERNAFALARPQKFQPVVEAGAKADLLSWWALKQSIVSGDPRERLATLEVLAKSLDARSVEVRARIQAVLGKPLN